MGYFASEVAEGDWAVKEGVKEPSHPVWAAVGQNMVLLAATGVTWFFSCVSLLLPG